MIKANIREKSVKLIKLKFYSNFTCRMKSKINQSNFWLS